MESFSSQSYSKLNDDRAWSSHEWKTETSTYDRSGRPDKTSWRMVRKVRPDHEEILLDGTAQSLRNGETLRDRSGRPDNINSQEVARPQNFIMGNEETELELSVESRSFVNRVNEQVRKKQKIISNVAGDEEEHSRIWGMFMAVTMESATFMGQNVQNNHNSIVNTADLTLKQMFDISAKLVTEQDEISVLETIGWERHSWKYLSLIGDERIINLQRTKVYVFSDSVLCLGRIHQNPESNKAWERRIGWITSSQSYRNFDGINGEPTEVVWHIFPGFDTLQLSEEVKRLLFRLEETPESFTGRILFMSMFNDISCRIEDNASECLANAKLVSLYARRFGKGQWSFSGPGSEKKWYSMKEDSPQGIWDNIAERMLLEFAESGCPIFRATTPLSRGQLKSKGHGKLSIHSSATQETFEAFFRIIVSANQLSLYGAVAEMCEEYESLHDRSGRPDGLQDERKTSRSQEINVNSFNEELSSSDRTGGLVGTEVNQTRSSEDSKSLNVEQTHDRTGRLVTDTAAVQDDSQVYHEANTLNIDDEVLRERMEKSIVVHDENHEPMMVTEADMDFRIPGLPHSVVKHAQSTSVRELIQKIENHPNRHALQQDLRQNQAYNPFSPESKQMIRDVGNIELCELLETDPKTQCKVCLSYWNIGIVYCTCGHFLRKGRRENQKFIKKTMDFLSIPEYVIKKGRPH